MTSICIKWLPVTIDKQTLKKDLEDITRQKVVKIQILKERPGMPGMAFIEVNDPDKFLKINYGNAEDLLYERTLDNGKTRICRPELVVAKTNKEVKAVAIKKGLSITTAERQRLDQIIDEADNSEGGAINKALSTAAEAVLS